MWWTIGDMSSDAPPATAPAPRTSMYARGSAANMVRSLLVIVGFMAVLFFAVARVNTASVPQVHIDSLARQVVAQTSWPIAVGKDLPEGWTPSAVRFLPSTDKLRVWHVGYQTPDRTYAAIEQTMNGTADWIRAQTNRAPKTDMLTINGQAWDVYVRDIKTQNSLVHEPAKPGELTTIVTGDATVADLTILAEHMAPFSG